ncbi:type VI secretion system-associated FHA domain protein TagH [Kosakonia sp. ML.JS2a]|uniref:type VI secretion system-associated FHA domain protein TagH n=1 Tax=Kosakonia sp. ML.JS2a TaxID=2980557 RepID=UPI0021D90216|nr:type VI secretion system-associated FHA domain protein TagH [Kosakonia sp. ML.JS2a]UXY12978.1 type VI secretion system-associated FHA domain protein TagH [Kosakonia sp. ML.JS2a]
MRFTIITSKPGHQPPQSRCDFYPPGGTIGRGTDNNLVLPDNDRSISRLQAIVHIAGNGECRITNRGNVTRVVLNDIPLERGRQVELQDGDILGIDDYRIEVTDLIQDTQPVSRMAASMQAEMFPPPVQAAKPAPARAPTAARGASSENAPASVPTEIWDSLMQEFSISDSISSSRTKPQDPQNLNPFAAPKEPERNPEDPLSLLNNNEPLVTPKSLASDQLFNDEQLFKNDSIFNDATPSALVPPVEHASKLPAADQDELDPLALFGGGGSSAPQARSDDPLGLLSGAAPLASVDDIAPIKPTFSEPPAPRAIITEPVVSEPPANPQPIITDLSASDLTGTPLFADDEPVTAPEESSEPQDYAGITLPTPQAVQRSAAQTPRGRLRIDPVQSYTAQSTPSTSSTGDSGDVLKGELLDALLEGMGLGDMQPVPQFDKENMRQFGQMLSMFSQGTVALLSSRSILKRGVKADMTMVLDDANNPFKLLPSGKTVLMQMFGTRMPGFMPPKKSVRDALIDLQAHQLGMISGIRAIIAAMLQSFNPEQLEEDAKRDGATARLGVLSNRKAALWDYFVRTYAQTAGEIDDDFHTLFGEAFLHAYDMEVNQYKDSQSGSEE